jgi:peptidoglycan/xylan/chitin deacetylase (PgdA/CDA1 family)
VAQRRRSIYRRRRPSPAARAIPFLLAAAFAGVLFALVTGWSTHTPAPSQPQPHRTRPEPLAQRTEPTRPPQFVVASFDGSGDADLLRYWRDVGRRAGARFTFFLSGVYLLGEERRALYLPPMHSAGASDIGFMQPSGNTSSAQHVRDLLQQLAASHREGHEIGTHFNGHFCLPYPGNVNEWNAQAWRQELAQFDELLSRASELNRIPRVDLGFGPEDVVGARTPCLQGNLDALDQVLREHGFRYESSSSARAGTWPERHHGIWRFPLPEIPLVGTNFNVISMDYNFMANQSPATTDSESQRVEEQTLASYLDAFTKSYHGNRAPFAIGTHFAHWNRGAYVRALTRFLERVCRLPQVRCVPYIDVVGWLGRHRR